MSSRVIGHTRSTIVDTIYAHTVDSSMTGVSECVAERIGLTLPTQTAPPNPPPRACQPPKLRVMMADSAPLVKISGRLKNQ
jgi:hypothetical protein